MPTYNSADYISETLDSLVASIGKHYKSCEVICVDDGSVDETVTIIKKYQEDYPVIRLIQNQHGGVSIARNTALHSIQGEYFTLVDSDDFYAEEFVNYFLDIKEEFDLMFTDVQGLEKVKVYSDISENKKLEIFKNTLGIGEYQIHPGVAGKFFRTEVIRENQLNYNQKLSTAEDILFNFSALTYSNTVRLDPVTFYKVNGTHSLMYFNEKNLSGQVEFVNQIRNILSTYPNSDNKLLVEQMVVLKAMTVFIDRYIGPLWLNGTYSLNQAVSLLKGTIEQNDYVKAFENNKLDYAIGNRYVVFRKCLHFRQYRLCLIYNRLMDKIRGFERFRA